VKKILKIKKRMKIARKINIAEKIINLETKAIDAIMGNIISFDGPFYENEKKKELREIYNYVIDELFIGWKHISNIASNVKSSLVFLLPEFISEKNLNDASIFISGLYRDQEIFIEFGPFSGTGKGPTYCHYYKNLKFRWFKNFKNNFSILEK
jgi:hypothetical protein